MSRVIAVLLLAVCGAWGQNVNGSGVYPAVPGVLSPPPGAPAGSLNVSGNLYQSGALIGGVSVPSPLTATPALAPTACTYYLDAATGSDSNNGTTQALAWLTFAHAEATATPTSSICVQNGTYTGTWTSSHTLSWYAVHPGLVIQQPSSGTYGAVVTCSGCIYSGIVFDSSVSTGYSVYLNTGAASLQFLYCTFRYGGTAQLATNANIANVTLISPTFLNGAASSISTIYGQYTNLLIYGGSTTLSGATHNWIRTAGTANSMSIYGHTVSGSGVVAGQVMISLLGSTSEYFTMQDSTINVTGNWSGLFTPGGAAGLGTMTLSHNNITYSKLAVAAISCGTAGYVFRIVNNTVSQTDATDTKGAIQLANSPGPLIQGNTITMQGSGDPVDVHSTGTAMGTATIWSNVLSTHNTSTGHGIACGTDADGGSGNVQIVCDVQFNTIYGPRYFNAATDNFNSHAIIVGYQHTPKVWNNRIIGEGLGIVIKNKGETVGGSMAFNTIVNPATQQVAAQLYLKGSSGVGVYNNTVYMGYTSSPASNAQVPCMENELNAAGQYSLNNVWKNNLCSVGTVGNLVLNQAAVEAATPNNVWDANAYYSTTGTYNNGAFVNSGATYASLATWQALGQDPAGLFGSDPLFANPSQYDFSLQAGSPLLGAGMVVPGVTGPAPNIGAWQGSSATNYASETVAWSATPAFSAALNLRASVINLFGNVTSFSLPPGNDGQQHALVFCQDATGSRTVAAPANVRGLGTVGSTASTCSSQTFEYFLSQSAWLATGAMVTNQ